MEFVKNGIFHIVFMYVISLTRLPAISAELEQYQQLYAIEETPKEVIFFTYLNLHTVGPRILYTLVM